MKPTKAISILTAFLVFALAMGAFSLSYAALMAMAEANGLTGWRAYIWPLLVDFSLIVFSLAVVRASLQGERTIWAWALVGLYTLATIGFNILHAPANLTAQIIAAVAPISLFLSFELLMSQLRSEINRHNLTLSREKLADQIANESGRLDSLQKTIAAKQATLNRLNNQIDDAKKGQLAGNLLQNLELANEARQVKIAKRREQVLTLLGQGLTTAAIADQLGVSIGTIKSDRRKLNGRVKA